MSAIDDLKNGAEQPRRANIDLASMTKGNTTRRSVSIDEAVRTKSTVDDVHVPKTESNQTYIQSLLDTENPNSDFMKHVTEKQEEAAEWIAEQEEKNTLEAEAAADKAALDEEDEDIEEESRGGVVIDMTKPAKEEDISNPEMTDAEDLSNANVVEFDITGSTDDEDEPEEEIDDISPAVEQQEITVEKEAVKQPEKKEIYTANISLEVAQETESSIDMTSGDEEDEEDIHIEETEEGNNEEYDRLRAITSERLKPVSLNLDLSSFTVAKKAKANVTNVFQSYKARISKWVLPNQKCTIHMKEFSGSELEMMMEYYQAARRSPDSMRRMYQMIYDHIVSSKPANFDTWLKVTPYSDLDNYFFAIYVASFSGANYIPIDCQDEKCGKSYITDHIDIMSKMVHFDSKEDRDKFTELYRSEAAPLSSGRYLSTIVPLNYQVAIGFKEATLWDIIEINSVDTNTAREFSSIIEYIPYIDNLYVIDMENKSLTPISYKEFPENPPRTTRSKIKKYNSIFNSMTVDEFTPVKAYISALLDKTTRGINYVIPETVCPECGHVNPERPIAQGQIADMVFTRCQLGALVTTSIN